MPIFKHDVHLLLLLSSFWNYQYVFRRYFHRFILTKQSLMVKIIFGDIAFNASIAQKY